MKFSQAAIDSLALPGVEVRYVGGKSFDNHHFDHGGHAWLEVSFPDGSRYGLDPTWMPGTDDLSRAFAMLRAAFAPVKRFYADHKHIPDHQLRALLPAGAAAPGGRGCR